GSLEAEALPLLLPLLALPRVLRVERWLATLEAALQRDDLKTREVQGLEAAVAERLDGHGHDGLAKGDHRLGAAAALLLRMRVESQLEEVQDVVKVALPVPLRIDVRWETDACQLSRDPALEQPLVVRVEALGLREVLEEVLRRLHLSGVAPEALAATL